MVELIVRSKSLNDWRYGLSSECSSFLARRIWFSNLSDDQIVESSPRRETLIKITVQYLQITNNTLPESVGDIPFKPLLVLMYLYPPKSHSFESKTLPRVDGWVEASKTHPAINGVNTRKHITHIPRSVVKAQSWNLAPRPFFLGLSSSSSDSAAGSDSGFEVSPCSRSIVL